MGAIHNELRKGVWSKALKRVLGVDQTEAGLERFGETLQPTLDFWARPEWALLRDEIAFARTVNSPAVAARLSTVQLINPAGSNLIAVVEQIIITAQGVQVYEIAAEQGDTVLGLNVTNQAGVAEDTRHPFLGEGSRCTLHTADVAAAIALPQLNVMTNATVSVIQLPVGFVLGPNSKLLIFGTSANVAFRASLRWRERTALGTEL